MRPSQLTIGHESCACSGATSFVGAVDELALYDRALTDIEVRAHGTVATTP